MGSLFASDITDTLEIDSSVVTIRKLSWKKLREAAQAKADAEIGFMAKAGRDVMASMREAMAFRQGGATPQESQQTVPSTDAPVDLETQREARYGGYDRGAVLLKGIKSISNGDGKPIPKLTEAIEDLDEATAERCHRAILDLSLPPIEPGAHEAAQKKV